MTREMKTPGAEHPISLTPVPNRVVVRTPQGSVLADTTAALAMQEAGYPVVHYVPLADVDQPLLQPTETSTYCPFKGDASYFEVRTEPELGDVVWTYAQPYPAMAEIAEHVAFVTDRVEVAVEPSPRA